MTEYNKLVRDRIPDMIESQGETAVTRILDDHEYLLCLEKKLDEELAEYRESGALEELADIMEVLYALAEARGYTKAALDDVRRAKHAERGGFEKKIFLIAKH